MIVDRSVDNRSANFLPQEIPVRDWREFAEAVNEGWVSSSSYIWRGQQAASWSLQSSFDRWLFSLSKKSDSSVLAERHLRRFKLAVRGRRGANPRRFTDDDEWWALAQHHAMKTPLLDWTESPYIALFFAFEKSSSEQGERAVWGYSLSTMQKSLLANKARKMGQDSSQSGTEALLINPIRPVQDDNQRLLSQAGLFTRVPLGQKFEEWIAENARPDSSPRALIKYAIPDIDREGCLRALNRMNINHMSLFPDMYGAGMYCNHALSIEDYASDI